MGISGAAKSGAHHAARHSLTSRGPDGALSQKPHPDSDGRRRLIHKPRGTSRGERDTESGLEPRAREP
jgi:hypothetical protein